MCSTYQVHDVGLRTLRGSIATAATLCFGRGTEPSPATTSSFSGSACSPPRTTYATRVTSSTTVTAASRTAVMKKRKRRRPGPDAGEGGGDDDGGPGDGGSWGHGWDSGGGGDEDQPWQVQNIWAWQVICIGSLLQAAHHLLMEAKHSDAKPHRTLEFGPILCAGSRLRLEPRAAASC